MCDKVLKGVAEKLVRCNVNECCAFMFHQPKLPKGVEKLRKDNFKQTM